MGLAISRLLSKLTSFWSRNVSTHYRKLSLSRMTDRHHSGNNTDVTDNLGHNTVQIKKSRSLHVRRVFHFHKYYLFPSPILLQPRSIPKLYYMKREATFILNAYISHIAYISYTVQ